MKKKMSNRDKTFWAVVIPVVVLFFAFNTLPMIKGVIYSFTNYKGYGSYDYVGLRNYTDLFTDARVGKSYLFTFKYAMLGLVVLAVGIWFLVQPKVVVSLIPIVIGLVLIFHSIRSIIEAVDARKYGYGGWSVGLIFSIISLIFGIICVTNAFDVMKTATVVVGIILIFNGVSNIWITSRATKAESAYNKQKEFEATFVEDRKEDN